MTTDQASQKPGFGSACRPKQFTKLARRRVQECVSVMEETYGKRCVFITGTLPGSSKRAMQALASFSGLVVQRFTQWLRDSGAGESWVLVWEFQKRGALHLHAVVASDDVLVLRKLERGFWKYWVGLVVRISQLAGVDLFETVNGGSWFALRRVVKANCRPVTKSVARYMSKYLSKGPTGRGADVRMAEDRAYPLSWWGAAKALRRQAVARSGVVVSMLLTGAKAQDAFERIGGWLAGASQWSACFVGRIFKGDSTLVTRFSMAGADLAFAAAVRQFTALGCFIPAHFPA